ncbi:hypothetical protein CYMTET_33771 [Cymbomonas tetramitiformis]|uniref:Ion transport domain-containing protein n=1 Tax=Cymbomonas tetramitiformis TaxID=36881 RepID=A0AAE0KQJ3_9CHLO|nr:hypothetical protein CYMTET_33771 [Cymbomonas tetramitiformis]
MELYNEEFIESIVTAEVKQWSCEMEAYLQRGLAAAQISLAERLRLKLKETSRREATNVKKTDSLQKLPEKAPPPASRNERRETIPPGNGFLLEATADSAPIGCDKPDSSVLFKDLFSVVDSVVSSENSSRGKKTLRSERDVSTLLSDGDDELPGTPTERIDEGAGLVEFSALTTSGQDDPELALPRGELQKIQLARKPAFRRIVAKKVMKGRYEGEEPREVTGLEKALERNMGRRTITGEVKNKKARRSSVTSQAKGAAQSLMLAVEKVAKADVASIASSAMEAARSNFAPRGASFANNKHKSASHWLLINPDSKYRRTWDMMLFLTLIYCAFAMPYNISFVPESKSFPLLMLDYITDAVFMLDLVLNFITMIKDKHGNLITDPQEVAKKYVQTWFFVDLVATVPMETILKQSTLSFLKIGKIMRLAKLGRMFRIVKLLSMVNILRSMEHSVSHPSIIRLFKLFFLIAAVVHWFACMTHSVASQYDDVDEWLRSNGYHDRKNSMKYLICVYWSSTTMLGEAKSPQGMHRLPPPCLQCLTLAMVDACNG